jgi:aminoglycoside 6'-N-acetyltransferase
VKCKVILGNELFIRRMNHNDFYLMVKWLNDQKVLEFYDEQPSSLDTVKQKYGPRIEGKHYVIPCIVEYKNEPIGYIQYYEIPEIELKKYGYKGSNHIYGIDQFIGETHLWGIGIGTSMIQMMIDYLSDKKGASRVVLEVKKNNHRAISSYKKCGFRVVKDLNNDLRLMEWQKEIR